MGVTIAGNPRLKRDAKLDAQMPNSMLSHKPGRTSGRMRRAGLPRRRPSAGVRTRRSAAVAPGWSGPGHRQSRAGARQEGGDFADGGLLASGFGQREVRLDLVAVAAAVFLLHHVAGCGQVGDDAGGAALGDAQAGRDVAQPHSRFVGDAQQDPGMAGQEIPALHLS